eukprot:11182950-Lingulodinium_polyedra.AAC.1
MRRGRAGMTPLNATDVEACARGAAVLAAQLPYRAGGLALLLPIVALVLRVRVVRPAVSRIARLLQLRSRHLAGAPGS